MNIEVGSTGLQLDYFLKAVSAIGYRIGNCGPGSSWGKHAEYKFRAIAGSRVGERGETDRYSGSQKSEVCPMPYALCPMLYALCRIVPHLSEKGYRLNKNEGNKQGRWQFLTL